MGMTHLVCLPLEYDQWLVPPDEVFDPHLYEDLDNCAS